MNYGNAIWIEAKARLAQVLIEQAWQQTLETGETKKPWNWADTYPIARLHHPATGTDLYVLEGSEGNSLAFGPGHNQSTATPGQGASIIGGHRDTHFSFLREVLLKDELLLQGIDGNWQKYQIDTKEIRHSKKEPLVIDKSSDDLYLITCYPFDSLIPEGPLRYVVVATPKVAIPKADKVKTVPDIPILVVRR